MHGIKTNIDFKQAVSWYEQAANAGYLPAVYNYARAMELKDTKAAAQLYEKVVNIIPQVALPLARLYENSLHDFIYDLSPFVYKIAVSLFLNILSNFYLDCNIGYYSVHCFYRQKKKMLCFLVSIPISL